MVNSRQASDAKKAWRIGLWLSLLVCVSAVLSLAPYMTSSTELVRMRNALLLDDRFDAAQDWTPPNYRPGFKLERSPAYPEFTRVVQQLGLSSMANDWDRAVAISKHLLGSRPVRTDTAIQSDLLNTYTRIVDHGEGYCGDFVDVFTGLAIAAGIPTRSWAFSFDGFGGHGHVWPEIWNRQIKAWQLLDVFNNSYFTLGDGRPLSALEFRSAMKEHASALRRHRLDVGARLGYPIEAKAWDYYRRGLPEWYRWRGNNVFSYDQSWPVRTFDNVSRSLVQLGAIAMDINPHLIVLSGPENKAAFESLQRLRWHLFGVMVIVPLGIFTALLCWLQLRRRVRIGARVGTAREHA